MLFDEYKYCVASELPTDAIQRFPNKYKKHFREVHNAFKQRGTDINHEISLFGLTVSFVYYQTYRNSLLDVYVTVPAGLPIVLHSCCRLTKWRGDLIKRSNEFAKGALSAVPPRDALHWINTFVEAGLYARKAGGRCVRSEMEFKQTQLADPFVAEEAMRLLSKFIVMYGYPEQWKKEVEGFDINPNAEWYYPHNHHEKTKIEMVYEAPDDIRHLPEFGIF
ncbi:hypothetical protein FHV99_004702 [Ochrobactrum sp. P20RRXII]|nr:hypothetical protein [Ochrobactrum sp. P20RRXII]NIH77450.1 hypothetical protein [Ochrobactrum sp. P20RRXII]